MIFRSPYPDTAVPNLALTPFVLRHATRLADKTALIDGATGGAMTYGQLARSITRIAAGLAERGFRKGDVFAIYAPNSVEYPIAFHAAASLGGIITTINPLFTADELAHQLAAAGARFLLTTPELMPKAEDAAARSGVREIIVLGDAPPGVSFSSLATDDPPALVAIQPAVDLVALPFSSGTTGLPKGVMLTHANMVANIAQTAGSESVTEDDVWLAILPFFHIYGLTTALNFGLATGGTTVVLARFEPVSFLQALEAYAVTRTRLVPPIVVALAKQPEVRQYDLSRLKVITCGGAPLSAAMQLACQERLGCVVKQGYGLTEASPVTTMSPDDPARVKAGSIGLLPPNTESRVVDPVSGADLGPDEPGELWFRGPQVMKGYLNGPEATAEMLDGDGWLRSGDIGFADAGGNFSVIDRLKELIKVKGYQVAPAELEAVLLTHPAVADAAVIPSPDDEAGEVPKAFVVLKEEVAAESLLAFVSERVAPYKKVRRIEFIDAIPKSASGKILRRVLVERERAASPVSV